VCKNSRRCVSIIWHTDNNRQFSMRDARGAYRFASPDFQGFEITCFLPQASKRDYLWCKTCSTPPYSRSSFRHSHQWVGLLRWPHTTRCSESLPMRSRRRTANISVTASTADTGVRSARLVARRTAWDAAAVEVRRAEHAVPEYAPSLVAFGRPPLAELAELRVK
jgi:hypothetical protein